MKGLKKHGIALRAGLVVALTLAVAFVTSGFGLDVSVTSNTGYLSISTNVALAAQPTQQQVDVDTHGTIIPSSQRQTQTSEAISVTSLGAAGLHDHTPISPWTALTGLSLTADDYIFVCDSADAGSTAVNVKHAAVSPTYGEQNDITGGDYDIYGVNWWAQSFTTTTTRSMVGIELYLTKNGSPSGNITVSLHLAEGGYPYKPTGSILATASLLASSITTGYNTFVLSYSLADATRYSIVVSVPNGDSSNYIDWDHFVGYSGGINVSSTDSGVTWTAGTSDFAFKVVTSLGYAAQDISLTADVTATNAGNVVVNIWSGKVTVTGTAYYIVVTNTSVSKAVAAYKASGIISASALDKYSPGTGSGNAPTSGATSALTQADELGIGAIGMEEEDDEAGTWTNGAANVSGNAQIACGNGGGAASTTIMSVAEVLSSTDAQTAAQTGTLSNDWAACVATYKMAPAYALTNTPDNVTMNSGSPLAINTTYYAKGTAPNNPVVEGDTIFVVTNTGIQCDLDIKLADFTGGVGWNISGSPGANEVKVTVYYVGQNPASGLVLTNSDQEWYDAFTVAGHFHWDFSLLTGSSFTDGVVKSGVITISAVVED